MALLEKGTWIMKNALLAAVFAVAMGAVATPAFACPQEPVKKADCQKKKAKAKPTWKPAPQPVQIKVVEKVVKEPYAVSSPSGPTTATSSSAVTIDQRQFTYKDPEADALRARLRAAEERARRAEARADAAEAKVDKARKAAAKSRFQARRYYERYSVLKARSTTVVNQSTEKQSCCEKKECDSCGPTCCDSAAGFYLGLVAGAAPHVQTEYCPEVDGYVVVGQQYRPVLGLRVSGVSSSGFAGGLSILSNKSALIDLNFRIK